MANSRDDDLDRSTDEVQDRGAPSKGPVIAALVLVGVLLSVILIAQFARPVGERSGDDGRVRLAINDHYTARNALNYDTFRDATCSAKTPPRDQFVAQNKQSRDTFGPIVIPEISDVRVDGGNASATVHWHYKDKAGAEATTQVSLVHQDDRWKVC